MTEQQKSTWRTKVGLAEMLKGGVIMDVTNADQAKIAEDAGATAVMALERVPADIRKEGGVARMADPLKIIEIMKAVSIPVMAKCRIGHFAEAQVLEALGVDYVDESEVLTPADESFHVNKHQFKVPFVCGCRDLGEALRRIGEGAAMIRTKGEAGSGNIVEAVRHMRTVMSHMRKIQGMREDELMAEAKNLGAPYELVLEIHRTGKLPVPNFSAGGIATPADTSLMMQLGAEAIFVGSGIFKSEDPAPRAKAIVDATTHYDDHKLIAELSKGLGKAMEGLDIRQLEEKDPLERQGLVAAMAVEIRGDRRQATGDREHAPNPKRVRIGVLGLQGDFQKHLETLGRIDGVEASVVRTPDEIDRCDGLVIPGGESTTVGKLMVRYGVDEAIKRRAARGMSVFGTCTGMILLAREIEGSDQPRLGLMDVTVRRNAFGRQVDSFEVDLRAPSICEGTVRAVFIRAPYITRVGNGTEVLATLETGEIVMARQGNCLAAAFHPELTSDIRVHKYFVEMAAVPNSSFVTRHS